MGQESGAPGRARTAPARIVPRYGWRWRARDAWRELRWRARYRPLYVAGMLWILLGAGMMLSTLVVPGLGRYPIGPCIVGVIAIAGGTWACSVKGRWRR